MRRWLLRGLRLGAAMVVLYGLAGFFTSRVHWIAERPGTASDAEPAFVVSTLRSAATGPSFGPTTHEVRGVLSVHSGRSHDSRGTLDEIARAARKARLDFVVLGDHVGDWLDPELVALEPVRLGGVLMVPGLELPVTDWGRTLAIGLDTVARTWPESPDSLARRIGAQRGLVSVVHSRSPRARERWEGIEAPGADSWEVLDVSEQARLRLREPWAAYHLTAFLFGQFGAWGPESILRLNREGTASPGLMAYDSARALQPLTLTAGLNHHAKVRIAGRPFPPFEPMFRTLVNHVELDDAPASGSPRAAREQLLDGIRAGRVFVSLGDAERASGFRFRARSGPNTAASGARLPWSPGARLLVKPPPAVERPLWVRLMADGAESGWYELGPGSWQEIPVPGPGAYRAEVFRPGVGVGRLRFDLRPWILSNPIEFTPARTPIALQASAPDLP